MRNPPDPRLEKWRKRFGVYTECQGNDGAFVVPFDHKTLLGVIASAGGGWEHVSVSPFRKQRTPTWEEMSFVKDLFWNEHEAVIQFHPPKALYINNHRWVLHMWRPIGIDIPFPPPSMVGVIGVSPEEAERDYQMLARMAGRG